MKYTLVMRDAEDFCRMIDGLSEDVVRRMVRWAHGKQSHSTLVAVLQEHAPDVWTFVDDATIAEWSQR